MTEQIRETFRRLFGGTPLLVRSPGRVNLIGEHTDYNEGFVLPAAVDRAIIFALGPGVGDRCRWHAADLGQDHETSVDALVRSPLGWPNYLAGTVAQLRQAGFPLPGFDCVFGGDIPVGAGMSSSAAIEAGLAFGLSHLYRLAVSPLQMATLAQKAENEFVGVRCGIMDQFVNIFGRAHHAVKLDCRSLAHEYVPFERNDIRIILCDTLVKHNLAASEYNVRRRQCEEGVGVLRRFAPDLRSLRDVSRELLDAHRPALEPLVYRRCDFVLRENARVLAACDDLRRNDFTAFGERMYGSHAGLRDDYEVSCKELDLLVEIASGIAGVFGARMMGGGFGGCTINLVEESRLAEFDALVNEAYRARVGKALRLYHSRISGGTSLIPA